ncbi:MAG: zinc ribbon domain-containing protein [Thermodesulfobacteriota bacterium]
MTYCNQCQLVHGEEQRFCQRCGQLLKRSPVGSTRPCARCGSLTFPGQKFCTDCGLPLRVSSAAKEEPQPRAPLFYPRSSEPRSSRRKRRPGLILSLIGLVLVVLGGIHAWRQITKPKASHLPVVTTPQEDLGREVERVAEKIRAAHLNKDINKWLSCYDANYPNLGRVENDILELWKNYDIKEVSYRISKVQRLHEGREASASIVWNIQVYDHRTHDYTLLRPSYKVTLAKVDGVWKIRDSKPEEGGGAS